MVKVKVKQEISNKWKYFLMLVCFAILLAFLNIGTDKIFEIFRNPNDSSNNNSSQKEREDVDSVSNSIESTSNICSICGKKFNNRGYEEVSEGVWRELAEGNQGQICSPACGRIHTQQFNDVPKKYGVDLENSETNTSSEAEYKMGNDGRVYEQNKCPLCKGTGIETGRNVATGETEGRICPMCEGRGVRSY
ncbi:hypothetical protein [Flavobacterium piscis]|uniref:Molecular chaperone DnaJ n=1 Tax=Flavobacterium piscis TaxID=1114874 RepID=A0ABU1Y9K2_9FLAO|nr:hypothetical protein [Flavobacterium piscis]MDR7210920.1 hypothetical protein [Flavobacterium piscis]